MSTTAVQDAWIYANGIDRINPKIGYERGNAVACCAQCNYAKLDYSEKEFIDHCYQVTTYQGHKKSGVI